MNYFAAFTSTILLFSACNPAVESEKTTIASNAAVPNTIPDSIRVSYEEALRLVANYAPKAGTVVEPDGTVTSNTQALWFSLEVMKAMIAQVEASDGDGVRFYLAAYDSTYANNQASRVPPRDYWGRNTLLMVPTQPVKDDDGETYHQDFYEALIKATLSNAVQDTIVSTIMNDAGMCPPKKGCKGGGLITPPRQ